MKTTPDQIDGQPRDKLTKEDHFSQRQPSAYAFVDILMNPFLHAFIASQVRLLVFIEK